MKVKFLSYLNYAQYFYPKAYSYEYLKFIYLIWLFILNYLRFELVFLHSSR